MKMFFAMFIISVYHHYERFLCCYKYEVYDSPAAGAGVQWNIYLQG